MPMSRPTVSQQGRDRQGGADLELHHGACARGHQLDSGWRLAARPCGALSATHEAGRENPWAIGDAPASYVDGLLRAIVGFELTISKLEGKWKLSQNRDDADRAWVRDGLLNDGHDALSHLMDQA